MRSSGPSGSHEVKASATFKDGAGAATLAQRHGALADPWPGGLDILNSQTDCAECAQTSGGRWDIIELFI